MADLLKRADAALYAAKGDGRGTIRFAAGDQDSATARLTLTARLRRALARDELELHYQPVFNVATGEAVAVEALLRWNDPERGMVPPGEFIPGAEDSGLIEPIGDWVVDAVIAQAAEWHAQGLHPDIAFNLSPRQLRSPGFAERLLGRFEAAGADPRQFIAEITESAAMADPEHTLPLLDRLAAAGLRLAIDDFGADFSSLARLRDLPVHELKIDRSFLRGVPQRRPRGRDRHRDHPTRAGARAVRGRRGRRGARRSSRSSPSTAARSPRASTWRDRCPPLRSRRCWRASTRRPCRRASRGSARATRPPSGRGRRSCRTCAGWRRGRSRRR